MIEVASLHVYPVKSCGGVTLAESAVGRTGLRYDRQWAFVDDQGMFVAQRDSRGLGVAVRTMCLIGTAIGGDLLTLTAPGMPPLAVPLAGAAGPEVPVQVWESRTSGVDQGVEAADWASEVLSRERPGRYRLVRMADATRRRSKIGDGELAYGDAYPFLVVGEASLADLNARLLTPLPMDRFRPNLVVRGAPPYAEDELDRFAIGEVVFTGTTRCIRCPITTTDQHTAERGKEPLKTLATYRRDVEGVVFGRNYNHAGAGVLRVGDCLVG
ncbi:MAG: MOSC domain-containing protein [Vicinamibacterales bacterium]